MPYNDEENKLIERMIDEEQVGPIGPGDVNAIPPPPPNWRDSVPTLTNIPTYKGKPNVLFADEETGDLIRYGGQGEEVERTVGQIPIKAKPPGRRPDNSQLTALEFVKSIDEDLKKDADEYANERVNEYMKNFSAADRILLSPEKKMDLDAKIAEIRNVAYNTRYGQGQTLARIEAERRARAEEAERVRKDKTPSKIELTDIMLNDKDPAKREKAKQLLDTLEASEARVAGSKVKATEEAKKTTQLGLLSPETLEIEGRKFATTGKMTAMGMGGGPYVRAAIINAGAKALIEDGVDPRTVPAMQTEFNAVANSYSKVKLAKEQIGSFEGAMIRNADFALELSKENYRTQIPAVNKVMNAIKTGTGDPKIVKFGAAIYAAAMEFEKIRTAGTNITSAELSVGAQKKAEEILNKAQTHDQLGSVISAMKTDASNITAAREETLSSLSSQMGSLTALFGKRVDNSQNKSGGISQRDLEFTAKKYGITVEEVKKRLENKRK